MTNKEDVEITDGNKEPKGFMVEFELRAHGMLISKHFPDKHAGERLIKTEEKAWELARMFAESHNEDYVNIYVIKEDFCPVEGYEEKILMKYP